MITSQDKQLISRLIKKYAGNVSTESMIAFVADTNGMLVVCRTLVSSNNNNDQFTISWVDKQCHDRNVDVRGFLYEVGEILSIFQPGYEAEDYYATLELEDCASDEDIKHAYRQLSRKYHPDTASSNDPGNADMFVKITKAYHALLEGEERSERITPSSPPINHWREKKKNHVTSERKKKNVFWLATLALVMIVISLIVAKNYKENAMIAGLQSSSGAFIPPNSPIELTDIMPNQAELPREQHEQIDLMENELIVEGSVVPFELPEDVNPDPDIEQISLPPEPHTIETSETLKEGISQSAIDTVISTKQSSPEKQIVKKATLVEKTTPAETIKETFEEISSNKKKTVAQPIENEIVKKQMVESIVKQEKLVVPTVAEVRASTQLRIDTFLSNYTKSYEDKDLLAFTRFFDLKATENGKPLAEVLSTYSALFQSADTISLVVNVLKWDNRNNTMQLSGRFQIGIQYGNGDEIYGKGVIAFLLLDTKKHLLIKDMTYKFDD